MPPRGGRTQKRPMIDSVMLWNEPNNLSHWDFSLDPTWGTFARMAKLASQAVRAEARSLIQVLGGISPIDPGFVENMRVQGVLEHVDVVAVHGFPLDWNHWQIDEWPAKLAEIRGVTSLPLWVTEVGVSTFGAEEVQEFGLRRTAELLLGRVPRVHWYSLYDLPRAWPATTRHREAEGELLLSPFSTWDCSARTGLPSAPPATSPNSRPGLGICQWFHFEDHRLDDAVSWLKRLGVRHVRTGFSWADAERPNAERWFDRLARALEPFTVTATFCFTPPSRGVREDHTSPPRKVEEFAEFCGRITRTYIR